MRRIESNARHAIGSVCAPRRSTWQLRSTYPPSFAPFREARALACAQALRNDQQAHSRWRRRRRPLGENPHDLHSDEIGFGMYSTRAVVAQRIHACAGAKLPDASTACSTSCHAIADTPSTAAADLLPQALPHHEAGATREFGQMDHRTTPDPGQRRHQIGMGLTANLGEARAMSAAPVGFYATAPTIHRNSRRLSERQADDQHGPAGTIEKVVPFREPGPPARPPQR